MTADCWIKQYRWTNIFFIFAMGLFLAAIPSHALAEKVNTYSADQVEISPDGTVINTTKIYVTKDAMRLDGMPGGGGPGMPKMNISMLIFTKQNKQYFYNHDKKLVFESELDEKMMGPGYQNLDAATSQKVLGKEKVAGYNCIKKEVESSFSVMGMTNKMRMIVWESDKFEFPLRTQNEEGGVVEMQNIDTGTPPKQLFQLPKGYQKVDNMMAVMGMDLGAMALQDRARDEEDPESAPQQNMENMNVEEMMEKMKQAMGENADPEQMAQMQQIMAQTLNQVKQTKEGEGAANDLWEIIPQRTGDKIGSEMKTSNMIDVILGTNSTLKQVFDFYGEELAARGWADGGTYIQNGQGTMSMTKDDQVIMFAWAENPGMEGNFKLFYNVHYTGPASGN